MWAGYCSAETLAPSPEPASHRTASLTSLKYTAASVGSCHLSEGFRQQVRLTEQYHLPEARWLIADWSPTNIHWVVGGGVLPYKPFHCNRFLSALQSVSVLVLDCLSGRKSLLEGGFQELLSSPHPHGSLLLCWYSRCPCLVTRQQTPASCTEPGH